MKPDQTVWAALRQATHVRHEAIEALLQLHHPLPLARYVRVLLGFEAFLTRWEPWVLPAVPDDLVQGWRQRSRLGLVRADLAALRAEPVPCTVPDFTQRLPLPDAASALGSMYVLEGSALGGQVIAKQVGAQLGLTPANGAAYFQGWGDETGRHWREFREALAARVPADGDACERACAAACRTFDLMIETFTLSLHEPAAA